MISTVISQYSFLHPEKYHKYINFIDKAQVAVKRSQVSLSNTDILNDDLKKDY